MFRETLAHSLGRKGISDASLFLAWLEESAIDKSRGSGLPAPERPEPGGVSFDVPAILVL